jgi:hypothetical protein
MGESCQKVKEFERLTKRKNSESLYSTCTLYHLTPLVSFIHSIVRGCCCCLYKYVSSLFFCQKMSWNLKGYHKRHLRHSAMFNFGFLTTLIFESDDLIWWTCFPTNKSHPLFLVSWVMIQRSKHTSLILHPLLARERLLALLAKDTINAAVITCIIILLPVPCCDALMQHIYTCIYNFIK